MPGSHTQKGSFLEAARQGSPVKPANKRQVRSPAESGQAMALSSVESGSQPSPMCTIPDQSEAAEYLGLNAPSGSSVGILCHAQQQGVIRPTTHPHPESLGAAATATTGQDPLEDHSMSDV